MSARVVYGLLARFHDPRTFLGLIPNTHCQLRRIESSSRGLSIHGRTWILRPCTCPAFCSFFSCRYFHSRIFSALSGCKKTDKAHFSGNHPEPPKKRASPEKRRHIVINPIFSFRCLLGTFSAKNCSGLGTRVPCKHKCQR